MRDFIFGWTTRLNITLQLALLVIEAFLRLFTLRKTLWSPFQTPRLKPCLCSSDAFRTLHTCATLTKGCNMFPKVWMCTTANKPRALLFSVQDKFLILAFNALLNWMAWRETLLDCRRKATTTACGGWLLPRLKGLSMWDLYAFIHGSYFNIVYCCLNRLKNDFKVRTLALYLNTLLAVNYKMFLTFYRWASFQHWVMCLTQTT